MRSLVLIAALVAGPVAAQEKPVIATVSYPLAYMAERLGGETADVLFPVPEGTDPAFWRPGIADIAAMQSADLIALNGASYAQWVTKASLPRSRLVTTSSGFATDFIPTETVTHSHGDGGEHSHTGVATHTWLDFDLASQQAGALAAAMIRRVPAAQDGLGDRLVALTSDLADLDARAKAVGAGLADRTVIASHPRYRYFARAYGLTIEALEWEAEAMPSDAEWAELEGMLVGVTAPIFLWEAEPPQEALDRAAGMGLVSVTFDPLANAPAGTDFIDAMGAVLTALENVPS